MKNTKWTHLSNEISSEASTHKSLFSLATSGGKRSTESSRETGGHVIIFALSPTIEVESIAVFIILKPVLLLLLLPSIPAYLSDECFPLGTCNYFWKLLYLPQFITQPRITLLLHQAFTFFTASTTTPTPPETPKASIPTSTWLLVLIEIFLVLHCLHQWPSLRSSHVFRELTGCKGWSWGDFNYVDSIYWWWL